MSVLLMWDFGRYDRCWMLDTGYWMLDTGYWILDAGYWMTKRITFGSDQYWTLCTPSGAYSPRAGGCALL